MLAITTTLTRPHGLAKITASCADGSIESPYPGEHSAQDAHAVIAMALVRKLGWRIDYVTWHAGKLSDCSYVFVWSDAHTNAYKASFE